LASTPNTEHGGNAVFPGDDGFVGPEPSRIHDRWIIVGSMIYGQMDFHQSICTSVEGAWDTDCNGATCGSIVGAASGARGLNSSLVAPLNDTIKPLVFGFQEITMSELAERTLQVYKNIAL
jgi:hypothetical protein